MNMRKRLPIACSPHYQLVLSAADLGLAQLRPVTQVSYPDGSTRLFEYDGQGLLVKVTEPDETVLTRSEDNIWCSSTGTRFSGTIAVVPENDEHGLPGTVIQRVMDASGAFLKTETIHFPNGISVESTYATDSTEIARTVVTLNGRTHTFRRESRHDLWYTRDNDIAHLPENPLEYGEPWKRPMLLAAL